MPISQSLAETLRKISIRHQELERLLSDPNIIANPSKYSELGREFSELREPAALYREFLASDRDLNDCLEIIESETEPELVQMAREEREEIQNRRDRAEARLIEYFSPKSEESNKGLFLEIRAGTGGDEAALFSGDLMRMYLRYAEKKGWKVESIRKHPCEIGGFKEAVVAIQGKDAWEMLRRESGAHRVQRVPATESGGRIHTSAATVAVMIEPDEVEVKIDPSDLRVDTFRASSAGGQHVNKTDSAIRITHLPTGTIVECQDERSQHQNRAKAMRLLRAKILQSLREEREREIASERKNQVGSGDRSERIRTYNFPEGRITDHRTDVKVYKLAYVLEGEMDSLLEPVRARFAEMEMDASLAKPGKV